MKQALLNNHYQSKRDWRQFLVSAGYVLWVGRKQTIFLLKMSLVRTEIKVIKNQRKRYTFILILTQPMEISSTILRDEAGILRTVRQSGLCSSLHFRSLRYGLPTGCFLDLASTHTESKFWCDLMSP